MDKKKKPPLVLQIILQHFYNSHFKVKINQRINNLIDSIKNKFLIHQKMEKITEIKIYIFSCINFKNNY